MLSAFCRATIVAASGSAGVGQGKPRMRTVPCGGIRPGGLCGPTTRAMSIDDRFEPDRPFFG